MLVFDGFPIFSGGGQVNINILFQFWKRCKCIQKPNRVHRQIAWSLATLSKQH